MLISDLALKLIEYEIRLEYVQEKGLKSEITGIPYSGILLIFSNISRRNIYIVEYRAGLLTLPGLYYLPGNTFQWYGFLYKL